MCFIAWIILGMIAGFIASQSANNSGAGDFRASSPLILRHPHDTHSRPRQSQNTPDCFYFLAPCAVGKRSIRGSVSPEILEPIRRQGRVHRRARDRTMPQPSLDRPGIVSLVGERMTAGMAKYVRIGLQFESEAPTGRARSSG
jgi:hypothetical protein